jgi:hypothetical protein
MNVAVILWTILAILSFVGQQVLMPMVLYTLGGSVGGYTVVFICSFTFNLIFWPMALYRQYKGMVSKETLKSIKPSSKVFKYIIISGLLNAINGILVVFASSSTRTPPALQPILLQSYILFTLILSKYWLGKNYKLVQYVAAIVVFVGIAVSLIPLFIQIAQGGQLEFQSGPIWALIMFFSTLPAVAMNIIEEKVFEQIRTFDIVYFMAISSLVQFLAVGLLFWTDLIPGFGTSSSFQVWASELTGGLACIANNYTGNGSNCSYCLIFFFMFTIAYCGTYVYQAALIKHASANFNAMVSSVVSPISTSFWILFPALNSWIGGPSTETIDLIFYLLSLAIVIPASFLFKKHEMEEKIHRIAKIEQNDA